MANVNQIEDSNKDLVDLEYFCSDFCARQSENYDGWFGCVELHTLEFCLTCAKPLAYVDEEAS